MESEKVKEIKKALACWQESVMLSTDENYVSHRVTNREILDYINELESENEKLKEENGALSCDLDYANEKLTNAEIEVDDYKDRIAELEKENAEQLKQFAERLKDEIGDMKKFFRSCLDRDYCGLTEDQIDEALKEFING